MTTRKVKVKTLSGADFEAEYNEETTIFDLKKFLEKNHPLKPTLLYQKLICSGKLAVNVQTVSEFVQNSEVIHLVYNGGNDSSKTNILNTKPVSSSAVNNSQNTQNSQTPGLIPSTSTSTAEPQIQNLNSLTENLSNNLLNALNVNIKAQIPAEISKEENQIKEILYQKYLLDQIKIKQQIEEIVEFMKYKNISNHPILDLDINALEGIVNENVLRKRKDVNKVSKTPSKSTEIKDNGLNSTEKVENTENTQGASGASGSAVENNQLNIQPNQNQQQQNPIENQNAEPRPQNNQPPAVDAEQFDFIDRVFSLVQIGFFLMIMYYRGAMGSIFTIFGMLILMVLYKLYTNGFFRPQRRNALGGNNPRPGINPGNTQNIRNSSTNMNNNAPPGFFSVLKTFFVSFVRSIVPEALPAGAQIE